MTYYRETWIDRHFGKFMLGFFAVIFFIIGLIATVQSERANMHYKQCLDDGKKEYECYAIVYNGGRR
jgi:glucose uptake protein GlcU